MMPAAYAHYRFGSQMLPRLPVNVKLIVERNRPLYDTGTHGPDIFFFHNPLWRTRTGDMGYRFHRQTGKVFFGGASRRLKVKRDEGALAYLFGVLTHFALDSRCHPIIVESSRLKVASHVSIESEFDRFLLEKDGKTPPHTQDLSRHLRLGKKDWSTISRIYSSVTPGQVGACLRNQKLFTRILSAPDRLPRRILKGATALLSDARDMMIPEEPDLRCARLNMRLQEQYDSAAERMPRMAEELWGNLTENMPLGEDFSEIFG